ncbi:MAG: FAD-dependent protein [Pseudomonadota bacterium]
MRYLLSNLQCELGEEKSNLALLIARALGGQTADYQRIVLERQSLDARHKGAIHLSCSFSFESDRTLPAGPRPGGARLELAPAPVSTTVARVSTPPRVVVVGTGPAGSFCALRLLDYGIAPVVLERGPAMEQRITAVERLWNHGVLDPDANAQFGEGGAGTFSDGKLTTRINHPATRHVLETFVRLGAPARILVQARPHVGTDVIRRCSVALRSEAETRGAQYRFGQALHDLRVDGDGRLRAALLASGEEIPCDALVLAPGHSARDTFEMLHAHGVAMEPKPFALGVRVEHPQELIDRSQYGRSVGHPSLPVADYRLSCNFDDQRAVYSFCMCPGGEVIQCSSEPGCVVVNGMSTAARASGLANAGVVAKVTTEDFASEHLLGGVYFQRRWEQAAFRAAGESYGAPAMAVQDFVQGRASGLIPRQSFRPHAVPADLETCLPGVVHAQLLRALPIFERKLHGFTGREALMLGVESRTSSPVRLLRDARGQSLTHPGLYPCGEGAGYAGGITSAAVDGIRVAEWIARAAGAPVFEPFVKQRR